VKKKNEGNSLKKKEKEKKREKQTKQKNIKKSYTKCYEEQNHLNY